MAKLNHLLLLVRDVTKSTQFYHEGLGLVINHFSPRWAMLSAGNTKIALKPATKSDTSVQTFDFLIDIPPSHSISIALFISHDPPPCFLFMLYFYLFFSFIASEAEYSVGYTPMLNFDVADLPMTVAKLIQLGAVLDGPIKYPLVGSVSLRPLCFFSIVHSQNPCAMTQCMCTI
jgi:catechol 2,3-dioxygenase-like lactoylglutathione lyase family enzyme